MAELADISANGRSTRTIAVESADAAAVMRVVERLGLRDHFNRSYPRALAALIDDLPERYATIDVGTNAVKFHIAARETPEHWGVVVDREEVTRLGAGLAESGAIGTAALERTIAAIAGMIDEARRQDVWAIAAVGTAGLRMAANGAGVVAAIRARTGVQIAVISGEEEARLAYLAASAGLDHAAGSLVVFETGGGSSQFSFGHGPVVDERFSVGVGAARYTQRFGLDRAVTVGVMHAAMRAIAADLSCLDERPAPDALVGIGGAVTAIAAVSHGITSRDPMAIHGVTVDRAEIDRQIELYRGRDASARRAVAGLPPQRAEVILAGASIVRIVMEKLGKSSLIVSARGLRHGLLIERFGR